MKTANTYPDFDEFENKTINILTNSLSRMYHLNREDREDVRQELAVFIFQHRDTYDPNHKSGCKYETYLRRCLKRKSNEIVRSVCPDIKIKIDYDKDIDTISNQSIKSNSNCMPMDMTALYSITTSSVLKKLTPTQSELFRKLCSGMNIAEIAVEEGVKYSTMYARVVKLRYILKENGFDVCFN